MMSCKRIRLVVKDSADESSYVPVLEAAGYVLLRDWLRTNDTDWTNMHKSNEAWKRINGGMSSTMRMLKHQ